MQRMLWMVVLLGWSSAARAEDGVVPVTLAEAVAAIDKAPAAQIDGHEIVAADARRDAAGAWHGVRR